MAYSQKASPMFLKAEFVTVCVAYTRGLEVSLVPSLGFCGVDSESISDVLEGPDRHVNR